MRENGNTAKNNEKPCDKAIPLPMLLADNIPTVAMFALGALIMGSLHWGAGIGFTVFCAFSIFWFWWKICPHCRHFSTRSCPCGYGVISAKLFRPKTGVSFKKVFGRNIVMLFPCWFVPPIAAVCQLVTYFSIYMLVCLALFCVTGFLVIPLISKLTGCKNCAIKEDCPWMSKS